MPSLRYLLPLLALSPTAPPRPDFAGLYRDGPRLEVATRREGDSLRLGLRAADAPARGRVWLTAWPAYDAKQPLWQDSLPLHGGALALPVARLAAGAVLRLCLVRPDNAAEQDAATTAWLRPTAETLARPFWLTDSAGQPLPRRYVRRGEAFGVGQFGLEQPVRWRRYAAPPAPALPPMTDPATQPAGPPTLAVLDSGTVAPGAGLRFGQPGLYALRVGGRGGEPVRTLAVLVAPNAYPALVTAAELIEPLRYLSTSAERQRLLAAPDPKRAVDRFWLDAAGGDQNRGRDLIRRYYGRVTAANRLFAAHKPGYLTDRGLLYVVLGPPPSVRRLPDGEERWFYPEAAPGAGPVTFRLRPRPSTFAPDNYELVRRPEYELLWYAAVEQWRTPPTAPSGPNGRSGR